VPELPEAESIARGIRAELLGRTIDRVVVTRHDFIHAAPEPIERLLPGRRVIEVGRRGKRVLLNFESGAGLILRLGMSGRVVICEPREPLERHTHVRMIVRETGRELRFRDPRRFGGIWWCSGFDPSGHDDLGPEPLSISRRDFRRLLGRRRKIKALLMDQRAVAGLGNIYCDESLHAAGIHPETVAASLSIDEADRLLLAIRRILRRAIRHNGTTLLDYRSPDGAEGSFRRLHRVYQREGEPCRTCRARVVRILAAGRSTFFCPNCQKRAR
jgi:formamidopyrimidine-DNA glycosylase